MEARSFELPICHGGKGRKRLIYVLSSLLNSWYLGQTADTSRKGETGVNAHKLYRCPNPRGELALPWEILEQGGIVSPPTIQDLQTQRVTKHRGQGSGADGTPTWQEKDGTEVCWSL